MAWQRTAFVFHMLLQKTDRLLNYYFAESDSVQVGERHERQTVRHQCSGIQGHICCYITSISLCELSRATKEWTLCPACLDNLCARLLLLCCLLQVTAQLQVLQNELRIVSKRIQVRRGWCWWWW